MAKRTIRINFPGINTATEHGDGVLIHWTTERTPSHTPMRVLCASVESVRPPSKRMEKYLREGGR